MISHKHSAKVLVLVISGILFFGLAISTSALAEEIFWRDDGTGYEYGKDTQGRPTTTIHYRKDPYEWSQHKGGKEVRTYDPKTGAPVHNQFFNDKGVLQWEEVINPETGETTKTDYFDLDGKPEITTRTYENYWVKEAALKRRGEYKEGWLDQFTKDDRSLSEGFNEWGNQVSDGLQQWARDTMDFLSGGSLGITKKGAQNAPAQPETPEPKRPETGNWDFLKEYNPRDFTPKSQSSPETIPNSTPTLTNFLGSSNEPTPKEIDYNKYGDAVGFDPQRSLTFVTNSKTGEITYFYPRHDDQFTDSQGGTQAVTMLKGNVVRTDNYDHLGELMAPASRDPLSQGAPENQKTEKKKTTPEERQKLYDQMNEQYEKERREKAYDKMNEEYEKKERDKKYDEMIKEYEEKQEKRYDKMIDEYERQEREKQYDKMIEEYERKERDKRYDQMIEEERKKQNKNAKDKSKPSAETKSAFSSSDALQQGGLGTLPAGGGTTPTATFDSAAVSGRDTGFGAGVLTANSGTGDKSDSECEME